MSEWYHKQIRNRNYLSPIGFIFLLEKAPKVSYLFRQRTSIPTFSIGTIDIPTAGFVGIPIEGNAVYSDLEMEFLVDENLENYMQIHNWMRALGTPTDYVDKEIEFAVIMKGLCMPPILRQMLLKNLLGMTECIRRCMIYLRKVVKPLYN